MLVPAVADAGLLDVNGSFIAELVAFILMLFALGRWVYPRIVAFAEAREQKIEAGLKAAEEAEKRLAAVQEDVQRILGEARGEARGIVDAATKAAAIEAEEMRRHAKEESDALVKRARDDIGAERDRALQELRAEVGSLVVIATTRVLGQVVDDEVHRRLIADAVKRVEGGGSAGNGAPAPSGGAAAPGAGGR